jgi:hypothetical protein
VLQEDEPVARYRLSHSEPQHAPFATHAADWSRIMRPLNHGCGQTCFSEAKE